LVAVRVIRILPLCTTLLICTIMLGLTISPVVAQQEKPTRSNPQNAAQTASKLTVPGDGKIVALICSTLIALNQANATGNYCVFREIGAPGFQLANSTAQLSEIFAELRSRNFNLSAIVLLQPKLLRRPEIDESGMLRVTGFFLTQPERLNFDLLYESVKGQWRLFGIAANTTPNEPEAPALGVTNAPAADAPKSRAVVPDAAVPAVKPRAAVQTGTPPPRTKPDLPGVRDRVDQLEAPSSAPIPQSQSSGDTNSSNSSGWFGWFR
jgi:hypothetical protein